jgi:hypothetical protein
MLPRKLRADIRPLFDRKGSGEMADLLNLLEEPEWRGQVKVEALRRVEGRTSRRLRPGLGSSRVVLHHWDSRPGLPCRRA